MEVEGSAEASGDELRMEGNPLQSAQSMRVDFEVGSEAFRHVFVTQPLK